MIAASGTVILLTVFIGLLIGLWYLYQFITGGMFQVEAF